MKIFKPYIEIGEGEIIPKFYGVAYPRINRLSIVCYIFPLNHIMRIVKNLWDRIRNANFTQEENESIERIFTKKDEFFKIERDKLEKEKNDFIRYQRVALLEMKCLIKKLKKG